MLRRKSAEQKAEAKVAKAAVKKSKKKSPKRKRTDGVAVRKPDTDVYTVMLILSFVAVTIGCILLWLELGQYGSWPQWQAG